MDYEKIALEYHERDPKGKIFTGISKPMNSKEDLATAYSPGVAGPCRKIHEDPQDAYTYTGKGNLVGVITNGTAVLGLGDIGPLAAKPVMEGKAALFKKFANIDVFDLELNANDPDEFCAAVKALEPTFGGINLEDIKAPECFYIEEKLRKEMNIPVFHDDQHGTAIIAASAFINALEITQRKIKETKVVFSGGGAAAIATAEIFIELGIPIENLTLCDSKGVVYRGRTDLNAYKERFALDTPKRSLSEALEGADAFVGVSVGGVLKAEMLSGMNPHPIIFALANPDPEIRPEDALEARPDAIIATGRSDYPNQVNNVLGFPFIFRGALDVQATSINSEMKLAAVYAIASLAKEDVPDEVQHAYSRTEPYQFGKDYLIPKPMDPRALYYVAPAVAKAAMESKVARKWIDIDKYRDQIEISMGPTQALIRKMRNRLTKSIRKKQKTPRIVIAHGHDRRILKAAAQLAADHAELELILLGNPNHLAELADQYGVSDFQRKAQVINPIDDDHFDQYVQDFYKMRQRHGISPNSARQYLRNHNYFAAMMVASGDADGMISGLVEPYADSVRPILQVIGVKENETLAGIHILAYKNRLFFFADTTINIDPDAQRLADIAEAAAAFASRYTKEELRVAMLAFSSYGSNKHPTSVRVAKACSILELRKVKFTFDGEVQADVATNARLQENEFPFCRLKGRANVMIFPDLTSANICSKLLASIQETTVTGPILIGTQKPANVLERGASTSDTINMIYLTAFQTLGNKTVYK